MALLKPSPLAPACFPDLPVVPGIEIATAQTGMRYKGRPDLLAVRADKNCAAAGVFTRSGMPSAPVIWSRNALAASGGRACGIVVNAGNANAFTGADGDEAAADTARHYGNLLGVPKEHILLASTGVIGEPLDPKPILAAMPDLQFGDKDWKAAAQAIGTTDTFLKGAGRKARIDDDTVILSGIAKGSGMIQPDMATMLSFVFTNAAIKPNVLQDLLREAVDQSFNAITVDSDTSTSDTVLMLATGTDVSHQMVTRADDPRIADFREALADLTRDLAHQVVRDGEGATKFITITVEGAKSDASAKKIGFAIANSPLIKTAIAGQDPNWGRIVMAVGKSGEPADRDRLRIWLGDQLVAENGRRHPAYEEAVAAEHMKGAEISIRLALGVGDGQATVWTCDLTHGYISINADYRS